MHHVEFLIEPFVEGDPGPHVTAALDACRELAVEVDFGPFGNSCFVERSRVAEVAAAVIGAAMEHGATHVNLHVSVVGDGEPSR